MLSATFKALGDLISPEFRSVLVKAILMTLGLFVAVLVVVEILVTYLVQFSWPWADWVLGIGTGLIFLVAFFFLMSPVTAAFAGLFLDNAAARVEHRHYPADVPGAALPVARAVIVCPLIDSTASEPSPSARPCDQQHYAGSCTMHPHSR